MQAELAFGELLKRHRLAIGLSQESLAERAAISTSAIGALERGERRAPYRETVEQLADALGVGGADREAFTNSAKRARERRSNVDPEASIHYLPLHVSSLVGRDVEIVEIDELLQNHRLVTVTGSGGVGKTRLVCEVARRGGGTRTDVRFVDLSPVSDAAFVAEAIGAAFDISLGPAEDAASLLAARVKTRECVVILDNCEHVVGEAARVASAMLGRCPGIRILATSRERLAIQGECVYRLAPLAVPEPNPKTLEEALACPSLRLFAERARAFDSRLTFDGEHLAMSADICRRLEGIPLALELAASRLPALGMAVLERHIKNRFVLSSDLRDMPQRQRTIGAAIAWSYDLLSEPECRLMRRLSVFHGGATYEAVGTACTGDDIPRDAIADLLSLLVDKSLLTVTPADRQSRYAMLESVRSFAFEKLVAAGELEAMSRAHARWVAVLAERAKTRITEVTTTVWLAEFEPELDNARAALQFLASSETEADDVMAARIVGGLRAFWVAIYRPVECRRWTTYLVERIDERRFPDAMMGLLAAHIQVTHGAPCLAAAARAAPLFEAAGDWSSLIGLQVNVAYEYRRLRDFAAAESAIAQAFAIAEQRGLRHSRRYIDALEVRAGIRLAAGKPEEAEADLDVATRLRNASGADDIKMHNLTCRGFIAFVRGDFRRSIDHFERCLGRKREAMSSVSRLANLAAAYLAAGELEAAAAASREGLELANVQLEFVWEAMWCYAAVAALCGHLHAAARLFGFASATCDVPEPAGQPLRRSSYEILLTALERALRPAEIAELQAEGARLGVERAVDLALALDLRRAAAAQTVRVTV